MKLSPWTFLIAPEGAQSIRAVESRGRGGGGGGLAPPKLQLTKGAPFLSKKCNF